MKNILILGLGLIGGSLAKALKESGLDYRIHAYDPDRLSLENALDDKSIDEQTSRFERPVKLDKMKYFTSDIINIDRGDNVIFVTEPGLLCDLYPFFDLCFVGGGFGKGIHSVLEPYIGGCDVLCGPNVSRSSEFSFIKGINPTKVTSLNLSSKLSDIKLDKIENIYRGVDRLEKAEMYLKNQADSIRKILEVL